MLESLLSLRHPGTRFEVVNAAMTAINSHVILPIARDCARADGDIWVLYMGNNEVVGPFGAGTVFGPATPPLPALSFANPNARHIPNTTYLDTGVAAAHGMTQNFTVAGWFRVAVTNPQAPICAHLDSITSKSGWSLALSGNNVPMMMVCNSTNLYSAVATDPPTPANKWAHAAGVVWLGE